MNAPALVHQGFIYASTAEFVTTLAPLLREGLARGDRVFAAAARPGVDALREELGADAASIDLHYTEQWAPRPFDRLLAVKRMVEGLPPGTRLRAFGEPVWGGSEAVQREWARYESVINVALARARLHFICLYDAAALPEHILEHGRRTHGELVTADGVHACDSFVPPEQYVPALAPAFAATPADAFPLPVARDQHAFRAELSAKARDQGLDGRRVEQLVLAANEVATNALVHGEHPISARLWRAGDELVCEVADAGPGIDDPLAGWRVPDPAIPGGWGLPMTRQLCDALEIGANGERTRVRLHMALA